MKKTSIHERFNLGDIQILSEALGRLGNDFTEFEYYTTAVSMGFKRSSEDFKKFIGETAMKERHSGGGKSYSKEVVGLYLKLMLLTEILST